MSGFSDATRTHLTDQYDRDLDDRAGVPRPASRSREILRDDGLSLTAACRTLRHLCDGHAEVEGDDRPRMLVLASGAQLAALLPLLAMHGFTAHRASHEGLTAALIDVMGVSGASSLDREDLALSLSEVARREAMAEWSERSAAGECPPGRNEYEAGSEAADKEYAWCMQQTTEFLQRRAQPAAIVGLD